MASNKEPITRPAFNVLDARTMYRILCNFESKITEIEESMLVTRLKKGLAEFLTLNGGAGEGVIETRKALEAESFDFESAMSKPLVEGTSMAGYSDLLAAGYTHEQILAMGISP